MIVPGFICPITIDVNMEIGFAFNEIFKALEDGKGKRKVIMGFPVLLNIKA